MKRKLILLITIFLVQNMYCQDGYEVIKNQSLKNETKFITKFIKQSFYLQNTDKLLKEDSSSILKKMPATIIEIGARFDLEHNIPTNNQMKGIGFRILQSEEAYRDSNLIFENSHVVYRDELLKKVLKNRYSYLFYEVEPKIFLLFVNIQELIDIKKIETLERGKKYSADYFTKNNKDLNLVEGIIKYNFTNNILNLSEIITNDNSSYLRLKYNIIVENRIYPRNCQFNN